MTFSTRRSRHKDLRLQGYDHSTPGGYFVTVCVRNRDCVLGAIVDGEMRPSGEEELVQAPWTSLTQRFPLVDLDAFVLMPNHIHGVIILSEPAETGDSHDLHTVAARFIAPACTPGPVRRLPALGEVVHTFKAVSTHSIRRDGNPGFAWQRDYYEHVIRNEHDLEQIRDYIVSNPAKWELDHENPAVSVSSSGVGRDESRRYTAGGGIDGS